MGRNGPDAKDQDPALLADIEEAVRKGIPVDSLRVKHGVAKGTLQSAHARVKGRIEAPPLDWESIPGPDRERLKKAKEIIQKRLEREFHVRLVAELDQYKAQCDENVSAFKAKLQTQSVAERRQRDEERRIYDLGIQVARANGLITPSDYRTILSCLHPDNSASESKRAEAFRLFNDARVKTLLVKEI